METFDLSRIKLSHYDKQRNLHLPKQPSEELAEFIGILAGDGYVSFNTNRNVISISGDSRYDYDYLNKHIKNLIKKLFNLDTRANKRKRAKYAEIYITSKGLINFLKYVGYYKHKSKNIKIPRWITNNNDFMIPFIQGVADTDFSLMLYKNRKIYPIYPKIGLTSVSKELVHIIGSWLNKKGFLVYIRKDKHFDKRTNNTGIEFRLTLSGRKNLEMWMDFIGFRNNRHLNKYKEYLDSGNISKKIGRPPIKLKLGTRRFESRKDFL
ncbi:MAG: hypothetical protein KKG75_03335 [Nanoarchaeota archaeon]|nr:hypothetical protein [Nanoarchaeota archaeon]